MKIIKLLLPAIVFIIAGGSAFSQTYTAASDTVKLNKEYVEVSNDIANITSKLTVAKNNLPGYHDKANDAASDAQDVATKSSNQASDAVNGNVKDAKKARRNAKRTVREAKDARHASDNVQDQNDKITNLSAALQKKQMRLKELDDMRATIRGAQ